MALFPMFLYAKRTTIRIAKAIKHFLILMHQSSNLHSLYLAYLIIPEMQNLLFIGLNTRQAIRILIVFSKGANQGVRLQPKQLEAFPR